MMMRLLRALLGLILAMLCLHSAGAQVRTIDVTTPRPAGWMVGDVIPLRIAISVDKSHPLQRASLPPRGSLNYWLELRDIQVREQEDDEARHYLIDLEYQTFYVPLDVQSREIPPLTLRFGEGEAAVSATIEPWSFSVSPLRGMSLREGDRIVHPEPDARQLPLATRDVLERMVVFGAVCLILVLLLARHYSVWPWHKRPQRPFSVALRRVRRARRSGNEAAWADALRALHRAFDQTAHRRVLTDDVGEFLSHYQAFSKVEPDILTFFTVSRLTFFAANPNQAMTLMSWQRLVELNRQLAAAERRQT